MEIDNEVCDNEDTPQMSVDDDISILSHIQRYVFDKIIEALENTKAPRCFYIDGQGERGKSFLLNFIINHMEIINVKVTSVAWIDK